MSDIMLGDVSPKLYLGEIPIFGGSEDLTMADEFAEVSANSFLTSYESWDWRNPFEIGVCIRKLTDSLLTNGIVFGGYASFFTSPKLNINDSSVGFVVPRSFSEDVDGLAIFIDYPLEKGVATYIRAGYDGEKIYVRKSIDGVSFTTLGERTLTGEIMYSANNRLAFGSINDSSGFRCTPNIEFLWHKCYVEVGGEVVWGREF